MPPGKGRSIKTALTEGAETAAPTAGKELSKGKGFQRFGTSGRAGGESWQSGGFMRFQTAAALNAAARFRLSGNGV